MANDRRLPVWCRAVSLRPVPRQPSSGDHMRRVATLLLLVVGACSQTPAVDPAPVPATQTPAASAPRPAAVAPIDVSALRADLTSFASDAFQGRLAGTPAAQRAAEFIAERLTAIG